MKLFLKLWCCEMTTLIVILSIIAVLAILAMTRFGVVIGYDGGVSVKARAAFLKFAIFPSERKAKIGPSRKAKVRKETEKGKKASAKKPLESFFQAVPYVTESAGRLRRKLTVNDLTLDILIGSPDPFDAAVLYGRTSAAVGAVLPVLENALRIKKRQIAVNVDFDAKETNIIFSVDLSLALWEILYVVSAILPLMNKSDQDKKLGDVKSNG